MAAFRRLISLVNKNTTIHFSYVSGICMDGIDIFKKSALKRVAIGLWITAGGVMAYHCYTSRDRIFLGRVNGMSSGRALFPSLPAVAAKEKIRRKFDDDEDVVSMSAHEHRFHLFSSLEHEGQLYMTPLNFIESVTSSQPKHKKFWRSLTKQEIEKILSDTPPVRKGSSNLFRNLHERGLIAYTEYLFLLCILTKPHAGFKIAFNMFDADGNQMVDKREFLMLEEIFRKKSMKKEKERRGDAEQSGQLQIEDNTMDTTLLVHFFGKEGKAELNFDDFYRFMDNLQTEVLEIEFLAYSQGMATISVDDFARILLRYTTVDNIGGYLENVRQSIPDEKGITFDEFRSFFQFLNNLEDFAIVMQMYNHASRSIGQEEFARGVYVATGLKLTQHLVNTVFKIFDVDGDKQLSYIEFIGIMKDRLQRGSWEFRAEERFTSFKACLKKELSRR